MIMKRRSIILLAILTLLALLISPISVSAAQSANDFYFSDAKYDFYLEKTADNTSKLHVVEELTAIFPQTNQNHGITRSIPYSNQDGKNITAMDVAELNFRAWRNGEVENVAKTEAAAGNYIFYLGSASEYVHGEQVYRLEYDFTNVITEFDANGNMTWTGQDAVFQELYWDTNGTGWSQNFNQLTANLHLSRELAARLKPLNDTVASCYVGNYGASGRNRCIISYDDQTSYDSSAQNASSSQSAEAVISFTTSDLNAWENLTFAVNFQPGTFSVPEPRQKQTYLFLITSIIALVFVTLILILMIRKYHKIVSPKKKYYKSLIVAPQYAPPEKLTVADVKELYIEPTRNSYVATLIELAIAKKILLIKTDNTNNGVFSKKPEWKIKVISAEGLTAAQENVLYILRGGPIHTGDEYEIRSHTATSVLEYKRKEYDTSTIKRLKNLGYLEGDKNHNFKIYSILLVIAAIAYGLISLIIMEDNSEAVIIGKELLYPVFFVDIVAVIVTTMIAGRAEKLANRTEKGLRANADIAGLKDYIGMAEADRLRFLQSIKGADTSDQGIVKLYEKLLPYAIIFDMEKSWLKELNHYYELNPDYDHNWYRGTDYFTATMFNRMMRDTSSNIISTTSYTSSSSSSSSSSGGGGGGFSGGGGGGGGGGGW